MIKIIIVIYYGWETEIGRYLCPSEYCIHSCRCHQVWRVHLHHHIAGQVVIVSCVHTCTLWWYLWCHLLMWGEQHKEETQKSAFKVGRHRPNLDFVHQSPGVGQDWCARSRFDWAAQTLNGKFLILSVSFAPHQQAASQRGCLSVDKVRLLC